MMIRELWRVCINMRSCFVEFWRGQVHGESQGPVHSRHMRPRCSLISRSEDQPESSGKDIALFLPYLHWEHHALQKRIQSEIDDANDEKKLQNLEGLDQKKRRVEKMRARVFTFEDLGESSQAGGSGTATPGGRSTKTDKARNLVEVAADHLRGPRDPRSSDDSDSDSEPREGLREKVQKMR